MSETLHSPEVHWLLMLTYTLGCHYHKTGDQLLTAKLAEAQEAVARRSLGPRLSNKYRSQNPHGCSVGHPPQLVLEISKFSGKIRDVGMYNDQIEPQALQ